MSRALVEAARRTCRRTLVFREAIANAPHRQQIAARRRIGLDLRAQPVDVGAHGVLVSVAANAPDLIEQLRAAVRLTRVAHEKSEQLALAHRSLDQPAISANLVLQQAQLEIGDLQKRRVFLGRTVERLHAT